MKHFVGLLSAALVLNVGVAHATMPGETELKAKASKLATIKDPAVSDSTVAIFVYPPTAALDWSSPEGLMTSGLGIELERTVDPGSPVKFQSDYNEPGQIDFNYRSTMGHTIGHVNCILPDGLRYNKWASFSGQDYRDLDNRNTFHDQLGMGMLFYDFPDGHIIAGEENVRRIIHYHGQRAAGTFHADTQLNPRFLQLAITPSKCEDVKEMISFFEGFHHPEGTTLAQLESHEVNHQLSEDLLYFNLMDPYETYLTRKQTGHGVVGGGCAPFGAAIIKMALGDQYDAVLDKAWRRPLIVSEKLIGGTVDSKTGEVRRVPIGQVVTGNTFLTRIALGAIGGHWTYEGIPNRTANLYDPSLIWKFVGEVQDCVADSKLCTANASEFIRAHQGIKNATPKIFSDDVAVYQQGAWDLVHTKRTIRGLEIN